jgi:hypothetical protein
LEDFPLVLARWQATIVDDNGDVIDGATVEVRSEAAGAPLVPIYSDREGTIPLGNPLTTGPDGFAPFHVAGGAYRITASKGTFSRTWRYVAIGTGGEIDSIAFVPYGPDQSIVGFNNMTQARIGGLWTDAPNFRPTPIQGVNIARFERVFIGAACDNDGSINPTGAGHTADWMEQLAHFTTSNAELAVVSQSGRHAFLAAVRSSDNNTSASNAIAASIYLDNDNATFRQQGYGIYVEAWRRAGQAFTTCMEVDINNFGNVVDMDPYSSSFEDTTSGFWLASGGEEAPFPNDASVGLAIINNHAKFRKGIVFADDSITGTDGVTGQGTAIAMALGHRIDWFSATSTKGISAWASAKGVLNIGSTDISTETFDLELGTGRTGNGACIIDLHAASNTDYEARIVRQSGPNGVFQIENAGTGAFQINASGNTVIQLLVNGGEAFRADGSGLNLASGKVLRMNGTQVVGAQGAAVLDATGGTTVDTQARAAINGLLARIRSGTGHGLIAA